jgi:branched-chain amino acid aminotransferase
MQGKYIYFNDQFFLENKAVITAENRAFRYGDGVFETMLWRPNGIRNLSDHVARIQHAFNVLKFEHAERFNAETIHQLVSKLLNKNESIHQLNRIRMQFFRSGGGFYSPVSNTPEWVIQSMPIIPESDKIGKQAGLRVGLYTEQYKPTYPLSNLKSINCLPVVLAGLFRKQQGFDEVILLNQEGRLCETLSSNIFVCYNNAIYTPALSEGCVDGTMRRAVIKIAKEMGKTIVEAKIQPQILLEADEIFLTNAIKGIQWVMGYEQKRYFNTLSKQLQDRVNLL